MPIPDQFVFTADTGSGLDPFNESGLSGITSSKVTRLAVSVGRGHKTGMPWLEGLRFFDRFFSSKLTPRVVTAQDANGNTLARIRSNRGLF